MELDALLIVQEERATFSFNRAKHTPGPAKPANVRQWTERMTWLENLPDPNPLLITITHTKRRQFAAEAAALEVSDLLDIGQRDKRDTLLLCLIGEAKMRCRDRPTGLRDLCADLCRAWARNWGFVRRRLGAFCRFSRAVAAMV